MKHEPLKGKVLLWNQITGDIETTDGKYFLETKTEDAKFFRIFLEKDVKSAVQGLLEEIDSSYGCVHHREEGGNDDCIICVVIGQTLNEVKRKIKKWFADVVEGEE